MNTINRSTVAATLFATIATALALTATQCPAQAVTQAAPARVPAAATSTVIYQLPRVVVTNRVQRAAMKIVDLPRVVVVVRRADSMETRLSQASARAAAPRS